VYKVETYALARHAYYIEGKSQRQITLELGLNRRTIQKMLLQSAPPGYLRSKEPSKPKLDPHKEWINEILASDKKAHPKQRHTAMRIYHRLQEERSYDGKYTIVRTYIASQRLKSKEMFVPLVHQPGMAQVDFGEAKVIIKGIEVLAHFFVMQLPFSDSLFVKAYPAENTETFCDGHTSAFTFFQGVPYRILYDNSKIAVKQILSNGDRITTTGFITLKSHYLFTAAFAAVCRGNEKGGVENLVGYARRNFMVPLPDFESFAALNESLSSSCRKREASILRGHSKNVGERLLQESFLPLPGLAYESFRLQPGKITKQALVRFQNNDYSVPTSYGCQKVWVKGYHDRVVIILESKVIAEHERSYGKEEMHFNPLHYLKLLERKAGAFEQAAPLAGWLLPPVFQKIQDILCRKSNNTKDGLREYIRILQFMENYSMEQLQRALEQALCLCVVGEVAILHLLRRNLEQRPPNLAIMNHHDIPAVLVAQTNLGAYKKLLLSTTGENYEAA
jgi:transposase